MTKMEYLYLALKHKCYAKLNWIISIIALTHELDQTSQSYPGKISRNITGVSFTSFDETKQIPITDVKSDEVIFTFKTPMHVTSDVCFNAPKEGIDTILGSVLFNLICVVEAFGAKIPFISGRVSVSVIENIVASKLSDNVDISQRTNDKIYVDEYLKFTNTLPYIRSLSPLCVYAATPTNITSRPGFKEYKQQLMKEYKDKLSDPIMVNEFESKLQAYDDVYMKDDPSNGKLIAGSAKVARKKLFLSIGSEAVFKKDPNQLPITESFEDGWPTDPRQFTDLVNSSRYGSYSRGNLTQQGGAAAKVVLRATNAYKVSTEDCGTTLGIPRRLDSKMIQQLAGREIRQKDQWVKIDKLESALPYTDKLIMLRSPMYCKSPGFSICAHCIGDLLALNADGITTAMTGVSSLLLTQALKSRHSKGLTVAEMDMDLAFS